MIPYFICMNLYLLLLEIIVIKFGQIEIHKIRTDIIRKSNLMNRQFYLIYIKLSSKKF